MQLSNSKATLTKVVVTDYKLFKNLGLLLSILVFILVLWFITDPITAIYVKGPPTLSVEKQATLVSLIDTCTSNYFSVFLTLVSAFMLLPLGGSLALSVSMW